MKLLRDCLDFLSAERLLRDCANGGDVIFLRSLIISIQIVILFELIKEVADPTSVFLSFDFKQFRLAVVHAIPWFGAIFAGVYAALYARFSSQWSYLAGLYNQIMASAIQMDTTNAHANQIMIKWKAGFVEDAEALHLARKPMFAAVVRALLNKQEVAAAYAKYTHGGADRLARLRRSLDEVLEEVGCGTRRDNAGTNN